MNPIIQHLDEVEMDFELREVIYALVRLHAIDPHAALGFKGAIYSELSAYKYDNNEERK